MFASTGLEARRVQRREMAAVRHWISIARIQNIRTPQSGVPSRDCWRILRRTSASRSILPLSWTFSARRRFPAPARMRWYHLTARVRSGRFLFSWIPSDLQMHPRCTLTGACKLQPLSRPDLTLISDTITKTCPGNGTQTSPPETASSTNQQVQQTPPLR